MIRRNLKTSSALLERTQPRTLLFAFVNFPRPFSVRRLDQGLIPASAHTGHIRARPPGWFAYETWPKCAVFKFLLFKKCQE
jgi:hypothetical protein